MKRAKNGCYFENSAHSLQSRPACVKKRSLHTGMQTPRFIPFRFGPFRFQFLQVAYVVGSEMPSLSATIPTAPFSTKIL